MDVRVPPGSRPRPRPRPPTPRRVTLAEQLAASSNLRDLLKLRDDDDVDSGQGEGRPAAAAARRRTLLDVIRDADEGRRPPSTVASVRRRVRPATAPGSTGTAAAPGSAARTESQRVSLMALLERAETQQWTSKRAGAVEAAAAPEEAEEDKGKGGGVGGRCCVCVARGKGAAFIPCGHTFCRACARELRAGRGRCPLCNATIREVLKLF